MQSYRLMADFFCLIHVFRGHFYSFNYKNLPLFYSCNYKNLPLFYSLKYKKCGIFYSSNCKIAIQYGFCHLWIML